MDRLRRSLPWLLLLAFLGLCEVAPGWFVRPDLRTNQEQIALLAGKLDRQHTLTQTFVAGGDGMCALEVFARIPPGRLNAPYILRLTLESQGNVLSTQTVLLTQLQSQPQLRYSFPVQRSSAGQQYSLRVESDAPPDTISLLASREDVYPAGELQQDGAPLGRDLAFRTYTAVTPSTLLGVLFDLRGEFAFCLAVTLLVGLVGGVGLALFGQVPGGGDWSLILPWLLGVGACLIVVLFAVLGVAWGWGLVALALLAVGWKVRRIPPALLEKRGVRGGFFSPLMKTPRSSHFLPSAQLLALFLWSLAVRLAQIDDLPAPLWVDGYRHVEMIARILAEGRLPAGLLYHTGYHSLVVAFQPLSTWFGLPDPALPRVMLLVGQWVGALGMIGLYPLARKLLRDSHLATLVAVTAISLWATFPAYLFNWSRYPFQLGLALLPLVLVAMMEGIQRISVNAKWIGSAALALLLVVGMSLSHYGTLSFLFSFGVVWLVVERPKLNWKISRQWMLRLVLGGAVLAGLALLLGILRFGVDLFKTLGDTWQALLAQSRQAGADLHYTEMIDLQLHDGFWLVLAGGLGGCLAAWSNRRLLGLTVGWFLAQAALITVQAPLLGYALASYGNLLLALGLPAAVLAGSLVLGLPDFFTHKANWVKYFHFVGNWRQLLQVGWIALCLVGGLRLVGLLNPTAVLMGPQDVQAMQWLRENTPADAVILINSNRWGSNEIVPCDGGSWVTAFTTRQTVFLDTIPTAESLTGFVRQRHVDYVYLGRSAGFLSQAILSDSGSTPVYAREGVSIYRISNQ